MRILSNHSCLCGVSVVMNLDVRATVNDVIVGDDVPRRRNSKPRTRCGSDEFFGVLSDGGCVLGNGGS